MNRTNRLLAIVLELQRHGMQRAEDLAATFETSKRTIYRDLDALAESGVPLVSTPGQGYSLVEGYFLPPLSFSNDEATMLLLGADTMTQNFDAQYRRAAQSAAAKIEGVLSEQRRNDVRAMQASLRVVTTFAGTDPEVLERLQMLRRAVVDCRRVRFRYYARFTGESHAANAAFREVDPYTLTFVERAWYLGAHDHKHQGFRRFRLDRMEALSVLSQTFARPDTGAIVKDQTRERDHERALIVQVRYDHAIARWVREARFWFARDYADTPDGLLVTYAIRHEDELIAHLLQWGHQFQILSPDSLRRRIHQIALAMAERHD